MSTLAERIAVLRDEALDTAERGDAPLGAEVFDAVIRLLTSFEQTDPGLDLALHDALSRRLAWGDDELTVLADADEVCARLLTAAARALRSAEEELLVIETVAEIGCTAARHIATAAVGRAGRDRATLMREQTALQRLQTALSHQQSALRR